MQSTQTTSEAQALQPADQVTEPTQPSLTPALEEQTVTPMTPAERALVYDYDLQRRRRLMTRIGSLLGVTASAIFFLVILGDLSRPANTNSPLLLRLIEYTIIGGTAVAFISSAVLARRNHVAAAVLIFALGSGALSPLSSLYTSLTTFFDPATWLFLAGSIVLVSVVGARWMIVATATGSSIIYIIGYIYSPRPAYIAPYYVREGPLIVVIVLIFFWGLTALFVFQWNSFQRTLLALGTARIEVVRAKRLDELKDQFIRSVNHELRTPIMTILGYLDLLVNPQTRDRQVAPERAKLYLQNAYLAGQSLRALLASILDTRRLDLGELGAEEFTLEPVVIKTALEETLPMIPMGHEAADGAQRDLHLSVSPELVALAEPVRVRQILTNLLTNALKYSPPGSPIEVTARAVVVGTSAGGARWRRRAEQEQQMVEIAVRDYGLGVPADQIPLLFQRFARLQRDMESNVTGTGLGLYICRILAERMGGGIRVESAGIPGQGSTFFVLLPAAPDNSTP